jgi:hypothetical protein
VVIATAVQKEAVVYVYDETECLIFAQPAGSGSSDGLISDASSTVNIQRGAFIYTYDAAGLEIAIAGAR